MAQTDNPRFYQVQTPHGTVRRNQRHLRQTPNITEDNVENTTDQNPLLSVPQSTPPSEEPLEEILPSAATPPRRSSRTVRAHERLINNI